MGEAIQTKTNGAHYVADRLANTERLEVHPQLRELASAVAELAEVVSALDRALEVLGNSPRAVGRPL